MSNLDLRAREQALDEREAAITALERALDGHWEAHERRDQSLSELRQYVHDREETLRRRAHALGLDDSDLAEFLGHDEVILGEDHEMEPDATADERIRVLDAREVLLGNREGLANRRQETLTQSEAAHNQIESTLLAHEHRVARAFRALMESAGKMQEMPPKAVFEPAKSRDETPGTALAGPEANRRTCNRIELHVSVDVDSRHNFYLGQAANISEGGIFIASESLLPKGRAVTLDLNLPGEGSIQIGGVVTWLSQEATEEAPRGFGVQFDSVDTAALEAIDRFIAKRTPDGPRSAF